MPTSMTIGEVANRSDVNVQTIRYYERRGLLPAPPRSSSGYRQYDASNVVRIRFIKRAQALQEELAFILDRGDGLANQLDDLIRSGREKAKGDVGQTPATARSAAEPNSARSFSKSARLCRRRLNFRFNVAA